MLMPMKQRTPPASALPAKAAGLPNGGGRPSSDAPVAKLALEQLREIARIKLPDLNTTDLDAAERTSPAPPAPWGSRWSTHGGHAMQQGPSPRREAATPRRRQHWVARRQQRRRPRSPVDGRSPSGRFIPF
jgi:hypothetical protein